MARDMRHGYAKSSRPEFQRKSQQREQEFVEPNISPKLVWLAVVLISFALLGGYFVVQHFATEGVGSRTEAQEERLLEEKSSEEIPVVGEKLPQVATIESPKIEEKLIEQVKSEALDETIRFTFYEGLSETEVVVYAEPIPIKLPEPYYILAGTFGRYEIARQEQDRLRRQGFDLDLNILELQRTYYRLRAGPFTNRLEMNKKRNALRRLGVDTMLIRVVPP